MCNSFALQSTVNHLHVLRVSILEFRFMVTIFEIEDTQLNPLFVSGILWVVPLYQGQYMPLDMRHCVPINSG